MYASTHPRPWRADSVFGEGPRLPMDQDRRAVWHARIELHRRAGNLTDGMAYVARALLKRLGQDGQCDPSHETLAADSGESVSTVKRALRALLALGMVSWVRRLVRAGWRCAQTSNQYLLSLGKAPEIRGADCDAQNERETPNCNKERKVQSGTVSNIARATRATPWLKAQRLAIPFQVMRTCRGFGVAANSLSNALLLKDNSSNSIGSVAGSMPASSQPFP